MDISSSSLATINLHPGIPLRPRGGGEGGKGTADISESSSGRFTRVRGRKNDPHRCGRVTNTNAPSSNANHQPAAKERKDKRRCQSKHIHASCDAQRAELTGKADICARSGAQGWIYVGLIVVRLMSASIGKVWTLLHTVAGIPHTHLGEESCHSSRWDACLYLVVRDQVPRGSKILLLAYCVK